VLRVLIAEDDRVALAPYHKPDLAVLDLWLADGDLGHIQQGVQVRDYVGTPEGESANLGLKIEGSWPTVQCSCFLTKTARGALPIGSDPGQSSSLCLRRKGGAQAKRSADRW
jgi:hypothetical protein